MEILSTLDKLLWAVLHLVAQVRRISGGLCKVRIRTADKDGGWRMADGGRRMADGGRRTADGGQ